MFGCKLDTTIVEFQCNDKLPVSLMLAVTVSGEAHSVLTINHQSVSFA